MWMRGYFDVSKTGQGKQKAPTSKYILQLHHIGEVLNKCKSLMFFIAYIVNSLNK